jgi:hypothetical protein
MLAGMNARPADDLSQRDLSNLRVEQMNMAERTELRRRYDAFVRALRPAAAQTDDEPGPTHAPRPWTPPRAR